MIQLTNYQFYQYIINYNIDQNIKTGIYCVNNKLLKPLLLEISGINKTTGIYYQSKNVYDNEQYFKERLFLDCNKKPFNTLHSKKITDIFANKYNTICNEETLQENIKKLKIRSEGKLKLNYTFTSLGKALFNNALALSIYKYPILLNALENINNANIKQELEKLYLNKGALFGVTNLYSYNNILDKLIILGYKNTYILSKNDSLVVLKKIINQDLIINLCNIEPLIIHKCIKNENIIIYNSLTSIQIKTLLKNNVKIETITIYQIGDYIC